MLYVALCLTHTRLVTDGLDCGFWVQTPCSNSEIYQRLEENCCLCFQDRPGVWPLYSHKFLSTFRRIGWFSSNRPPWRHTNRSVIVFQSLIACTGAWDGAVCWGTALQAGRSRVRFPNGVVGSFHWHNPSGRAMAMGSTQPLTEMSTRNIS